MTTSVPDRLQDFADRSSPPPRPVAARSRVPNINQRTIYWGAGMVGVAIVLMIIIRIIGGSSFGGDILVLGGVGVLLCGMMFCASALGAWYYNDNKRKQSKSGPNWVPAAVVDRQIDASGPEAVVFVFLELTDGRRIRLQPVSASARAAGVDDIGWAAFRNSQLLDFITE